MYTAINFIQNADGVAISYSLLPYKSYLLDLKNKGYKPDLWGFKTRALAESTANGLVGTVLADTLPPVMQALRGGQISQPAPAPAVDDESQSARESEQTEDSGLENQEIRD